MTLALANRKDAIRARLAEAFPEGAGYGWFDVKLARKRKREPRVIVVSWVAYPFEEQVAQALGDLYADDVQFDRYRFWSCGIRHDDAMEAWKAHEGAHHLDYPRDWCGQPDYEAEKVLPEDVEADLIADGETFESACVPGNFVKCPTCGGYGRYMPDRKALRYEPCPDCVRLGIDRGSFPGILDMDDPAHRAFYEGVLDGIRDKARAEAARIEAKRTKALAEPTTTARPTWLPLPTRDAGLLNGIPVVSAAPGCDYLAHADDPERRVRCDNRAGWFDPTTALRVCTRHRTEGNAG